MSEQIYGGLPTSNLVPANSEFLSKEDIAALKNDLLKEFEEANQISFIRMCQRSMLDPFSGQVVPIKRMRKVRDDKKGWTYVEKLTWVTSVGGLVSTAIKTGLYDGCTLEWVGLDGVWKDAWLDVDQFPVAARCIVKVKNRSLPEVAIAHFRSYAQRSKDEGGDYTEFWRRMPEHMIGKCAKALALRGAFPDRLSGIYAHEELGSGVDTDAEQDIDEDEAKVAANQRREDEIRAHPPAGAKFVEEKPGTKRPTPAEALAPLPPGFARQLEKDLAEARPQAETSISAAEFQRELDEARAQRDVQKEPDEIDIMGEATSGSEADFWWKDYVVASPFKTAGFQGKRVGDLTVMQMQAVEEKWVPAVRNNKGRASQAQLDDLKAFEARLAHDKASNPF